MSGIDKNEPWFIYLFIYLGLGKVLGSSQDVINLKEEIMASQVVQEEKSWLSHHRLWNKNRYQYTSICWRKQWKYVLFMQYFFK